MNDSHLVVFVSLLPGMAVWYASPPNRSNDSEDLHLKPIYHISKKLVTLALKRCSFPARGERPREHLKPPPTIDLLSLLTCDFTDLHFASAAKRTDGRTTALQGARSICPPSTDNSAKPARDNRVTGESASVYRIPNPHSRRKPRRPRLLEKLQPGVAWGCA